MNSVQELELFLAGGVHLSESIDWSQAAATRTAAGLQVTWTLNKNCSKVSIFLPDKSIPARCLISAFAFFITMLDEIGGELLGLHLLGYLVHFLV